VDFRERFIVDGRPLDPDRIVAWVSRWTPDVERLGATFFEATTAMAFDFFRDASVDVAVIETGLGGRLDATNVVTPMVATVTNIGIDHVEYLGATRELIAAEKAGIFKAGAPAVIGEPDGVISGLLAGIARQRGASSVHVLSGTDRAVEIQVRDQGTSFAFAGHRWTTPLVGDHQAVNASVALATVAALPERFRPPTAVQAAGLAKTFVPGRFHRVGRYLFDVAHNPAGARVLAATLRSAPPAGPIVAVLSVLSDKDWRGIMAALAPVVSEFILTVAPTSPAIRTWSLPEPLDYARQNGWRASVTRDFDRALTRAAGGVGTVLVTGSFHTVGDAMARLEVSPTAG
jgi:dihydrofolate synthase/folylpolyglutamate synthase